MVFAVKVIMLLLTEAVTVDAESALTALESAEAMEALVLRHPAGGGPAYSQRKSTIGSTLVARLAAV